MVEPLFVADDLDGHGLSSTIVTTMKHLPKRPLAKSVDDFVTICQVIMSNDKVVAAFVVVAKVVGRVLQRGRLLLASGTDVVHRRIFEYLLAFVIG